MSFFEPSSVLNCPDRMLLFIPEIIVLYWPLSMFEVIASDKSVTMIKSGDCVWRIRGMSCFGWDAIDKIRITTWDNYWYWKKVRTDKRRSERNNKKEDLFLYQKNCLSKNLSERRKNKMISFLILFIKMSRIVIYFILFDLFFYINLIWIF